MIKFVSLNNRIINLTHTTVHIFSCPSHPTSLTEKDLRESSRLASEFLLASFLWSLSPSLESPPFTGVIVRRLKPLSGDWWCGWQCKLSYLTMNWKKSLGRNKAKNSVCFFPACGIFTPLLSPSLSLFVYEL